jgi:aldehyde:ferredoxin oxidoreductase
MKPVVEKVGRFGKMHGWANRILRVNLSDMRIEVQEAAAYVPAFLGARGIAAKICWDEYPEPIAPFDPANPLMVFPGALTGSRSPYSGRANICAFSPQAYPHHWFTRSSIGAHFGAELKRAGYDGLVVTGASETPVRLRIRDDEVSILPADELWGQDTMDTLESLESMDGKRVRSLVIGPAGERLSRIATIHAASSSASGQGGFGGVMGSKNLKAISVIGSGRVSLAEPETVVSMARALAAILVEEGERGPRFFGRDLKLLNERLAAEGNGQARCQSCTEGCLTPCAAYFQDMPGAVHNRKWSGSWFCVSAICFPGSDEETAPATKSIFDWQLERRAAFEMNVLSNRYGLNQYDILVGMVPWLIACQKAGLISELDGQDMDWRSPEFWARFLRAIAYRQGLGDVLAEGGWAAAQALRLGVDLARRRYTGWGHAGHWDGREGYPYPFPFWLASALQWMSDTRDPFSTGHGSLWPAWAAEQTAKQGSGADLAAALGQIRAISERVYQSPEAADPLSGYAGKAHIGFFHTVRPVIKDCVPVDDLVFPLIYSLNEADHYSRLRDIEGIGEIEGPSIEYHLFRAGTGVDWPEEEFRRAAERICTLERALQVRHWARDRQTDEMVLPYFEEPELYPNPVLGKRLGLDREQFGPVMDEFYQLHGWDVERAWPTPERLSELDLEGMYQPMIEGATRAADGE